MLHLAVASRHMDFSKCTHTCKHDSYICSKSAWLWIVTWKRGRRRRSSYPQHKKTGPLSGPVNIHSANPLIVRFARSGWHLPCFRGCRAITDPWVSSTLNKKFVISFSVIYYTWNQRKCKRFFGEIPSLYTYSFICTFSAGKADTNGGTYWLYA